MSPFEKVLSWESCERTLEDVTKALLEMQSYAARTVAVVEKSFAKKSAADLGVVEQIVDTRSAKRENLPMLGYNDSVFETIERSESLRLGLQTSLESVCSRTDRQLAAPCFDFV